MATKQTKQTIAQAMTKLNEGLAQVKVETASAIDAIEEATALVDELIALFGE